MSGSGNVFSMTAAYGRSPNPIDTNGLSGGGGGNNLPPGGSGGDNGGMELLRHRLDAVEKASDKTNDKLDKLIDTTHGLNNTLSAVSGRLDLIEKKLPNWWQPYAGIGVVGALLVAALRLFAH